MKSNKLRKWRVKWIALIAIFALLLQTLDLPISVFATDGSGERTEVSDENTGVSETEESSSKDASSEKEKDKNQTNPNAVVSKVAKGQFKEVSIPKQEVEKAKEYSEKAKIEDKKEKKEQQEEKKRIEKENKEQEKYEKEKNAGINKEKEKLEKESKKLLNKDVTIDKENTNLEVPEVEDVLGEEALEQEEVETLTVNDKGEILYGDLPLYVGQGDELIPAKLDELMKKGVKEELTFGDKVESFLFGSKVSAAAPSIVYDGQVSYGGSIVGDFKVNGEQAFCIEHSKSTPSTGAKYGTPSPYDNVKVARALYYGWSGPKNIFGSDKARGIVVTSLVLSRAYNGVNAGGNSISGYSTLWDKVNSDSLPDNSVSMSDSDLSVSVSGGVQKSQTTTFKADSKNSITFNLPSSVKLVNESNGKSKTGGSVTIYGGEKFHLEAPLNYEGNFDSGVKKGSMEGYRAIVSVPSSSGYQRLSYGEWFTDPTETVQFKAVFKKRQVTMTIHYNDRDAHAVIDKYTRTKTVTIGDKYSESYRTDVKIDGARETVLDDDTVESGTVPDKDFTITFWYKAKYKLWIEYIDSDNGSKLRDDSDGGNYYIDESYSRTVASTMTANSMDYKIAQSTAVTGKMVKGGKTVQVKYDPYVNLTVRHLDNYNGSVLKTENKGQVKVGSSYNLTGMTSNFTQNSHQYRITGGNTKTGTIPRKDLVVDFKYDPYNVLKVRHIDTYNNGVLSTDDKGYIKVGSTYNITGKTTNFVQNGHQYRITGSKTLTGTMPYSDKTIDFKYDPYNVLKVRHIDTYNNGVLSTDDKGYIKVGSSYNITGKTANFVQNGHQYRITGTTTQSGTMPYSDKTLDFKYDPYNKLSVKHIDTYNNSVLSTDDKGYIKVGANYSATGKTTNFIQNGHQYRITGSTSLSGTMPYADKVLEFKYNPYNVLTVRHIDTYNNGVLSTENKGYIKVGDSYNLTGKTTNFIQNGHQYRITGSKTFTGTMPYADKVVDFKYDPYNTLTVRHIDTYNKGVLSTDNKGYIKVGSEYSLTGKIANFIQDGHQYRIVAPTSVKATMPYSDKTVDFNYDPYNVLKVNNIDTYNRKVLWTDDKGYVKVGSQYNHLGKTTANFEQGGHWYNIIAPFSQRGTMPYKDLTLTMAYDPYNKVTIENTDTYNDSVIWTDNIGLVRVGDSYSYTGNTTKNFLKNTHYYNIIAPSSLTGKMPYNDLKLEFKYDPYQYITLYEKNMYPAYDLFKTTKSLFKVGTTNTFKATQTHTVDNGARVFDVFGDSVTIKTPYKDSEHTFDYKLRRTITVNYYDVRTGNKVSETKTYTLHEKDKYSEKPITIKDGEYTLRYVKTDGDSESGTVGTKHITVNYYYDKPMIKVGLEKIQIYTAKSTEGLPVKINLSKVVNYSGDTSKIADFKDTNKTVKVTLYQGSTVIQTQTYTAQQFPEKLDWEIDKKFLTKNAHKPYTVKIETGRDYDFHIVEGREDLTTEGWTSNESTITFDVNSKANNQDSKSFVVMTEKTPTTAMKEYFEKLTYKATPLGETKTGYGVSTNVTFAYENDLGTNYKLATNVPSNSMKFYAPNSLRDSYLDYPTVSNNMEMDMVNTETSKQEGGKFKQSSTFIFPHVNVEKQTGNLFTDNQVSNGDSRIKNGMRDGGNVFYTPIWNDLGTFNVSYKTSEIGVHKFKLNMTDTLKLSAHMFVHMDSETIPEDEILLVPINADNPFNGEVPEGWTQADVDWLKYNN